MNSNSVDCHGPETSDPRELLKNRLRVELRDQRIEVNSLEKEKKKTTKVISDRGYP